MKLIDRLNTIGDALSQFANTLPPFNGDANESLSGRAYRTGSRWEIIIDKLFFLQVRHCQKSYEKDIQYCRDKIKKHEEKLDRESGFFTP